MPEYEPLTWTLGDRLAKTLKDADLDISTMAWLLRRHRNSVSKWLKNDGLEPDTHTLIQWASALADNSSLDRDVILGFLGVTPEQVAADRRHVERRGRGRVPTRRVANPPPGQGGDMPGLPGDGSTCTHFIGLGASPESGITMGTQVRIHAGRRIEESIVLTRPEPPILSVAPIDAPDGEPIVVQAA